jgi:hypothetical protein
MKISTFLKVIIWLLSKLPRYFGKPWNLHCKCTVHMAIMEGDMGIFLK